MGKNQGVIEINGKRYNAATGQLLSSTGAVPAKPVHTVDGFVRHSQPASKLHHASKLAAMPKPAVVVPPRASPAHRPVAVMDVMPRSGHTHTKNHLKHHQPEVAKTLMRSAVKKPVQRSVHVAKQRTQAVALAAAPAVAIAPKSSFHNIDPARLKHAERVAQSRMVSRFGYVEPTLHEPMANNHKIHKSASQALPPAPPKTRAADLFEQALARATSHEESTRSLKKSRARRRAHLKRRALNVTAAVLAVLLMGGFIAYLNRASLTMRVASAKAGFHAALPGWQPNGFAVGSFKYHPGFVAVQFNSHNDSRNYTLTQKASNWDSATLLDDFVAANNSSYQTVESAGRTIYLYGDSDATWVSHGVQYILQSNDNLNTNQLVQIATST